MKVKISLAVNFCLIVIVILYLIWQYSTSSRIAYVQSAVLVDKYEGMKEARAVFRSKLEKWQEEVSRLKGKYENAVQAFSKAKVGNRVELLKKMEASKSELDSFVKRIEATSRTEEDVIIQGALNQINQFISDYSKRENLQLVLGVNLSGNILYGDEFIDITDEVLEELNRKYNGR